MEFIQRNLLTIVWVAALLGLIALNYAIVGKSASQFPGVASSREQAISFQYPVEVVRVVVVEGEAVQAGDVLLEVRRPDLDSELAIIENRMTEIKTRHLESTATTRARLESLRAKERERLAEIDTQIRTLESRHRLNLKFLGEITGDGEKGSATTEISPLVTEIEGLKRERDHVKKSLRAQIKNLERQLGANIRPADVQLAELEKRRDELVRQAEDLKVRAEFPGSVGSVIFKEGELVSPYSAIVTLHSPYPNYVKGYIHEDVINEVEVGQQVWVVPGRSEDAGGPIAAVVESLGSRIVEYPDRLKRNPRVSAWGREVVIRLPVDSSILLGEKVSVVLQNPVSPREHIMAFLEKLSYTVGKSYAVDLPDRTGDGVNVSFDETRPIAGPGGVAGSSYLEASGVVWDGPAGRYLLVSDETEKGGPVLYEMNEYGEVMAVSPVVGKAGIDDIESISLDGNDVYLVSSLSHNKKGVLKKKRRNIVRLTRAGEGYEVSGSVDLYGVLERLTHQERVDEDLASFLSRGIEEGSLDVESHLVREGALYLGFKSPFGEDGKTVIIKLNDVGDLFAGEGIRGGIWRSISLPRTASGKTMFLSDMAMGESVVYLLAVTAGRKSAESALFSFDMESARLRRIAAFASQKAEGFAYGGKKGGHMVVFDGGGSSPSRFFIIPDQYFRMA